MKLVAGKDLEWRKIMSGASATMAYESWEYHGEIIHYTKILGPVGRKERLPFIRDSLAVNKTENFFTLADNSHNFHSILSYEDMHFFGEMIAAAGIKRAFNVVVTHDAAHETVARLLGAISELKQLHTVTFSARDFNEAEQYTIDRINQIASKE